MLYAEKSDVPFLGIQETRRNRRVYFEAPTAGYTVYGSLHCTGDGGKPELLGVGLAVSYAIAREIVAPIEPEIIIASFMKVRITFRRT